MLPTEKSGLYAEIWRKITFELSGLMADFNVWLARLNEVEKLLGLCVFIVVLMLLAVRQPSERKEKSSLSLQFVMALTLVMMFGFGIGWIIDPMTFRSLVSMS